MDAIDSGKKAIDGAYKLWTEKYQNRFPTLTAKDLIAKVHHNRRKNRLSSHTPQMVQSSKETRMNRRNQKWAEENEKKLYECYVHAKKSGKKLLMGHIRSGWRDI